ncbi:hypothetical protein [Amycolatopsis thermophila]|uniref:Uncharacterized protein n=1 Tax=Amycolatopsis thermophila TaxID=206084 RepID=A0ABU0ENC6_9PSEU|nr:hypothetical protein [Amycolatopsis thermophila]MDQ0376506.1 hypothetical protein [Amycolatopsis thermophila]
MVERLNGPYQGDPWDRQPGESDRQFARFNDYLEMEPGKRSFAAVAEKYGLDRSTVADAAEKYRWRERVAQWDGHRTRERRAAIMQQEISLAERQMMLATAATAVLSHSVRQHIDRKTVLDPKDMPGWARMVEVFRRMALDKPDQVIELTGADRGPIQVEEFKDLSPEQVRDRAAEMARSVLRVVEGGKAS